MTELQFETTFTRFLNDYWGAFHELLEAESVKPERLAKSLFEDVVEAHDQFGRECPESARPAFDALAELWRRVADHRETVPDAPLTADQVRLAMAAFTRIYDAIHALGRPYPSTRARVLRHALHSTPKKPLRADAAP